MSKILASIFPNLASISKNGDAAQSRVLKKFSPSVKNEILAAKQHQFGL